MSEDGAAVNAVSLAELCVGDAHPETVADRIRSWGITLLDVPAAVAEPCAKAYLEYRERRRTESGRDAPLLPLPDFFIGAHAQVMGWPLATADEGRFRTYFPSGHLTDPLIRMPGKASAALNRRADSRGLTKGGPDSRSGPSSPGTFSKGDPKS